MKTIPEKDAERGPLTEFVAEYRARPENAFDSLPLDQQIVRLKQTVDYLTRRAEGAEQERDTLARECERQKALNGLLQRQIDGLPFCPDCRDKVRHESCPRCRYQAAESQRDTLARRVAWQPVEQLEQRGRLFAFNANRGVDGMVTWWPGGGFNGEGCWCWDGETIAWSRQRGNQPTHGIVPPAPPVRDEEAERP